jgi:hypothetical protein
MFIINQIVQIICVSFKNKKLVNVGFAQDFRGKLQKIQGMQSIRCKAS